MMKRCLSILFLLATISLQAVDTKSQSGWRNRLQSARQTVARIRQTMADKTLCIRKGVCKPGEKEQITNLAKKLGIAVAATVAIATAAAAAGIATTMIENEEEKPLLISTPEVKRGVSVAQIAQKHNIPVQKTASGEIYIDIEKSAVGPLFQAINVNAPGEVAPLSDNLNINELNFAIEYAQQLGHDSIVKILRNIKEGFELLVNKVASGVLRVVKEVYCLFLPTKRAIQESLEHAYARMRNNPGVFGPIVEFLNNPQCPL